MTNEEAFGKWFNDFHIKEHPHYKELKDFAFAGWEARLAYMQEQSKPVGYVVDTPNMYGATIRHGLIHNTELFTTPQRQQPLKQLSEKEVQQVLSKFSNYHLIAPQSIFNFAYAIMDAMQEKNKNV